MHMNIDRNAFIVGVHDTNIFLYVNQVEMNWISFIQKKKK